MKCPNCHNDNFEYEKYCHVCGTKLTSEDNSQNDGKDSNKFSTKDILARLILVLVFALTIILYQLRSFGMI